MQQLNYKQLKTGIAITLFTALILIAMTFAIGKNNLFLLLNADLGIIADYFFKYYTNLGDGIFWIAWLIVFIIYRRKLIPLLVAAFVFSTVFTHLFKDFLIPNAPRPTKAITDLSLIHTVTGVELWKVGSFPSGHTATAFTFFLLACLLIDKKWIIPIGFIFALLVAYSRVYLAEHFPHDTAGGMIAAILTVLLSLWVQQLYRKKTSQIQAPA